MQPLVAQIQVTVARTAQAIAALQLAAASHTVTPSHPPNSLNFF